MKKEAFCVGLLTILCAIIIVPILYYSMLSIPYADDFSNTLKAKNDLEQCDSYFVAGLINTAKTYTIQQGTFTSAFLSVFFSPFLRGGFLGLRLFNTISVLALFLSIFFVVYMFVKCLFKCENELLTSLIIYCPLLFCITNNYMNAEVYTWYIVIVAYLIPCLFTLLGTGFYLRYLRKEEIDYIWAIIFGVLAAGGSINISTLCCGFYFLIAIYAVFQKKLSALKAISPFGASVIATIVNVVAPGNYARFGAVETHVGIIEAFFSALKQVILRILSSSIDTPLIVVCIVTFVFLYDRISFAYDGLISFKHPVLVGLFFLLAVAIVNLPYTYGTQINFSEGTFEDRASFIQDVTLYLLLFLWIIYFIGYLNNKYPFLCFSESHYYLVSVISLFAGICFLSGTEGKTLTTPYMIQCIADGSAHSYSDYQEELFEAIEGGDDIVYLYYDYNKAPKTDKFIRGLGLPGMNSDPTLQWVNNTVASLYGKQRIYVVYPE